MQPNQMEMHLTNLLSADAQLRANAEHYINSLDKMKLQNELTTQLNNPQFSEIVPILLRKSLDELPDAKMVLEAALPFQSNAQVQYLIATILKSNDVSFDNLSLDTLVKCLEIAPMKFNVEQVFSLIQSSSNQAFTGFCQYLIAVKPDVQQMQPVMQHFVSTLTEEFYEPLAEVADYCSTYLIECHVPFLQSCFRHATTSSVECAISFIEQNADKVDQHLIHQFMQVLMPMISQSSLSDDEFHNFEEDDEGNFVLAEMTLDRLSRAYLNQLDLLPWFNTLLSTSPFGAFFLLSAMIEGQPETQIDVNVILKYFTDPNPRVRFAAIHCIGQLSTDIPDVMLLHYQSILQALLHCMSQDVLRVQCHAANASMNLIEHLESEQMQPFAEMFMSSYGALFNHQKCQAVCISAVATLADALQSHFQQYMSIVPQFIGLCQNNADMEIVCKLIECMTLIALAVDRPAIDPYITDIMAVLRHYASIEDSECISYCMVGYTRLCRVLKMEFLPYIQEAMQIVFHYANHEPAIELIEQDEQDAYKEKGWFVANIESNRVAVNTSQLEDMATSIEMMGIYADTLKSHFTFANECVDIVVPLVQFMFSDDVRQASIQCIPKLINCLADKSACVPYAIKEFTAALEQEVDYECTPDLYNALQLYVEYMEMDDKKATMESIVQILHSAKEMEMDDTIHATLYAIVQLMQAMWMKTDFKGIFQQMIYPIVIDFIQSNIVEFEEFACLCMCDVYEYGDLEYCKQVLITAPLMHKQLQAVTYGIGVLAQRGLVIAEYVPMIVNEMQNKAHTEGGLDNCIAALVKMALKGVPNLDEVIMNALPMTADEEEFEVVYSYCINKLNMVPAEKQVEILIKPTYKALLIKCSEQFKQNYKQCIKHLMGDARFKQLLQQYIMQLNVAQQKFVQQYIE